MRLWNIKYTANIFKSVEHWVCIYSGQSIISWFEKLSPVCFSPFPAETTKSRFIKAKKSQPADSDGEKGLWKKSVSSCDNIVYP